ncbi:ABC transporter ATP-binding protein [Azospirillum sp. CT11-132]|uniref:ABC transporter ATP-binding protein n=1 Tax=unclassified Azospirillum TaxID=2630922 RepID=UPI0010AB293F|nr:ABC transporter ATP-binding protein [Azospirillum sp. TSA2s]QCG94581.1 ABC transporter ATP-binding protein [Azospirillum sp. TSA2s]
MESQGFVEFSGVQKSYDGRTLVIEGLDLSIPKGEFLTMLGPSGSGKTTSLMMLAGFEAPSRGEIRVAGKPIQNVPPHRRNIGMVFQNYALFPHMTIAENLAYPLKVRRMGRAETEQRVARALDMVQMGALAQRRPSQLSGGQQQRVALARALVFEPDLVLMDEPLGALDKNLREHMQFEIKHLHERLGVTMVYVTHDQAEALTMSDRIAVFNRGRVEQLATPAELYEEPATVFVAGFIGENNRLSGVLVDRQGDSGTVKLESGSVVQARVAAGLEAGASVTVSLRPERVRLAPAGEAGGEGLFAHVAELIYLGDHIRVHLADGPAAGLVAKIPNNADHQHVRPGGRYQMEWGPADAIALPVGP